MALSGKHDALCKVIGVSRCKVVTPPPPGTIPGTTAWPRQKGKHVIALHVRSVTSILSKNPLLIPVG